MPLFRIMSRTKRGAVNADREEINESAEGASDEICIVLDCRTIRIGSHKYTPREKVLISSKGIRMVAPIIEGDGEDGEAVLQLQSRELVKVLMHSGKALPVLFLYTMQSCGAYVRKSLHMTDSNGPYYNPVAKEEQLKRITLLPYAITDETKNNLKKIFGTCIDDLSPREANDILIRTCPRELQMTAKMMTRASSNLSAGKNSSAGGIRQILIYPPGKGGISINTEDYMCLAQDQFLNDVIIDFYLSYLCQDILTPSQRDKTHVFSTFFYKRLTTKHTKKMSNAYESDAMLTPAQKRHARVKSWTKNVNIFHRDYVVIPINENCHWFLAIICFPGLDSCRSFLNDKPVVPQEMKKKDRKSMLQIGNTTITPMMKQEQMSLNYNDSDNLSERDEAEADESDLDMLGSESDNDESEPKSRTENKDSDDSSPNNNRAKEAIKQPCILIFDSLAGASRSRVVATLRDYLTCEYHAKISPDKKFTKDNIKGSCPKIPQQNNFTDCGLYLLQYVEHFFKHPVTDYQLPIKQLANWFDEIVVTRKREEISNLLKNLMINNNVEIETLPDISFPTLNGKLIESSEQENGDITDQQSSSGTPPKEKDRESGYSIIPKLADVTGNGDEDPASVRKTLRLSSETVVAPKHSDIVKDIQNSLIKNKVNQDKGATANNSFNILVSASSDPEGGLSQIVLKNRRSSKNDDDASDSKKIKLNQQN